MGKLVQFCTKASLYEGPFGGTAGWLAAGMGYILVTDNGKLCVVDGGKAEDADNFISLLKKYGGECPTVEMWILTHPHFDHIGVLDHISRAPELQDQLKIKELVYCFPESFIEKNGNTPNNAMNRNMRRIMKKFGAVKHTPTLRETRDVDGMVFNFLYHPYDTVILNGIGNCNFCSLVFTVQGKHKKVMFTGDAYARNLQVVEWLYRKQLACDILQMPHHGLCDTGHLEFYKSVNAKTLLIPTCIAGARAMHGELYADSENRGFNLWAEENAEKIYYSFDGTVELEI